MEKSTLVGGESLNTHESGSCIGQYCTVHNNSDHHMVKWNQTWDFRIGRIMRICPHKVAHTDPDEINPNTAHDCDGCCNPESQFKDDLEELTKSYINTTGSAGEGMHFHSLDPDTVKLLKDKWLGSYISTIIEPSGITKNTKHRGIDIK